METLMEEDRITPAPESAGNAPMSLEDGAQAIREKLFRKPEKATPDASPEPEQAQAEEDTATAKEPDDGSTPDVPEADEPDASPEPETPVTFRLPDGREVTPEQVIEWERGQLRQSDYTRKTQELAEQRKAFEQRQAEIAHKAQAYEEQANIALAVLSQKLPPEPDMQMWRDDPIGAAQQKAEHDAVIAEYQRIQEGLRRHHEGKQAEQLKAFKEMEAKEAEMLLTKLPQLRDTAKVQQMASDIQTHILPHYGFKSDELASIYDHRVAVMLADLVEFRKLKAQAPKATQKAETAAPVVKSGTRQSPADAKARALRDAKDRLKREGTLEAGAEAIRRKLFG